MEVDMGATLSIISEATYQSLCPKDCAPPLQASSIKLKTCTKEQIRVNITYLTQNAKLNLLIVDPSLLSRDWLQHVRLDWTQLNHHSMLKLQQILDQHPEVFKNELGRNNKVFQVYLILFITKWNKNLTK